MKSFLLLALIGWSCQTLAQTGTVTGKMVNEDGLPVPGVAIQSLDDKIGVASSSDGSFVLGGLTPGTQHLRFSHVGYQTNRLMIFVQAGETVQAPVMVLIEAPVGFNEVLVTAPAINPFRTDSVFAIARLPISDLENPQVAHSIPAVVLKEQAVTDMNAALKNATGVTRLWESTGRGGDGAEYYTMRGFSVQPTMVNGVAGVNNGALDPANIQSIDIIKGPSGTLFGSSLVSYGGLINITTKSPTSRLSGEVSSQTGSNNLNRIAADVNVPINEEVFSRVNLAWQSESSFQDAGYRKSVFVAPAFAWTVSPGFSIRLNTEFFESETVNAPMIFLNRYSALTFNSLESFRKNYNQSFTSNDLPINNPAYNLQMISSYQVSDTWTSQTILGRSNSKTTGYYQYLWDFSDGRTFGRYISRRNGETTTTTIQQNFIGDFTMAGIRNRVVVGADYLLLAIQNGSSGWVSNGTVTLDDGKDTGDLTRAGVDNLLTGTFEGNSTGESEIIGGYVSALVDPIDQLSFMASIRADRFSGKTSYWVEEKVKSQTTLSPKLGMVWRPFGSQVSVFANYLNGFSNVAPVEIADTNGANPRLKSFDPEQANQWETGIKSLWWDNRLSLTISYYDIQVKDRVMSDPTNINNSIQGGEVESRGIEATLIANPIDGWSILAGFSNNHSEVTRDNPEDGYLGLRPEEAGPETITNVWTSWQFQSGPFQGVGVGAGFVSASEHKTLNRATTGTFTLPAYTIFSGSVSWAVNRFRTQIKVDNLTNERYFSGWSTVTPQKPRTASLNVSYQF